MLKKAVLWEPSGKTGEIRCSLCAHRCVIKTGQYGICGMRRNVDGELYTSTYSNVIASHVDPIEKKPLYHFMPGTLSYSIAAPGCNFKCSFCQNWRISQLSCRDGNGDTGYELKPEEVVREAVKSGCRSISYTYTEPTIFFEYAQDTALLAEKNGLRNCFVTNGFMTGEAIDMMAPWLDAANVDLKSFNEGFYRDVCGGRLEPVLDSIRYMKKKGIWIEITTLIVPGENDSEEETGEIARFIASVDRDIPWHISRYHPDYKHPAPASTDISSMRKAAEKGRSAGLRYVYLGNVAEGTGTVCPSCGNSALDRTGSYTNDTVPAFKGKCPSCATSLPGIWEKEAT